MSCGFDKGLLAAHYDGETTHGEGVEVERHVGSCPECARDLAAMRELSATLKPLGRAAAPMSIAEGVMREIGATERARGPWIRWGLSAAAAVLIGAVAFVALDQRDAPEPDGVAVAPAFNRKEKAHGEESKALEAEPSPPAAETPAAPRGRVAESEERARGARPAVPVVRVSAADVAGARAEVEVFLKEREMTLAPGAPLLGVSSVVRDRYLQLDLTDAELKELEKRLAALKETTLARGSLEAEKKRVAEDLAKLKSADGITLGAKKDEEAAKERADDDSSVQLDQEGGQAVPRRKVILVFETVEAKK